MSTDTTVKYFHSGMLGAPQKTGSAGDVIGVLDACLVNGFNTSTVTSLAVADNVATLVVAAGHGFEMVGQTGPVILISGATPSSLNGQWRVQSVADASTLTFSTSGISNQTASGTITVKHAPAGWTKAFSGTNIAAYRNDPVLGTGGYLRVQDNHTAPSSIQNVFVRGYMAMSDVDTGTDPAPPEAVSVYFIKQEATGVAAPYTAWYIYADATACYVVFRQAAIDGRGASHFFGDIDSVIPGDGYQFAVIGNFAGETNRSLLEQFNYSHASGGPYIARAYNQVGTAALFKTSGHALSGGYIGSAGYVYPSPGSEGLVVAPIECYEGSVLRGFLPGLYCPAASPTAFDAVECISGPLAGRTLYSQLLRTSYSYKGMFDITGPW